MMKTTQRDNNTSHVISSTALSPLDENTFICKLNTLDNILVNMYCMQIRGIDCIHVTISKLSYCDLWQVIVLFFNALNYDIVNPSDNLITVTLCDKVYQ